MTYIHGRSCVEDPCDFCQKRAEERADPEPDIDYAGERMYEAYLDRLGD